MILPNLDVALKEWDIVCRALETGQQIILLRKGGIIEAIGGFELEQSQFLLFPTFLHQNAEMLKADAREQIIPASAEPEQIAIRSAAEVTDILRVTSRQQMDALDAEHIWAPPLVDMRFNYRPKNPLYLLIVRSYLLPAAMTIQNKPDFAGCKSWVPLSQSIDCSRATPVISHDIFERRRETIRAQVAAKAESR